MSNKNRIFTNEEVFSIFQEARKKVLTASQAMLLNRATSQWISDCMEGIAIAEREFAERMEEE